jgi:NSS family neurotransmitter:Na+ symporter
MSLTNRDGFSGKFGVIAAAAGSAVGLGNIWRFPYITGENGGGAFLLIYLLAVVLLGIPVILSEFVIGRKSQANALGAFESFQPGKPWWLIGLMGIVAAFVILSFYTTVAGWTLEYIVQSITGGFHNKSTTELADDFNNFNGLFISSFIMAINLYVTHSMDCFCGYSKRNRKIHKNSYASAFNNDYCSLHKKP